MLLDGRLNEEDALGDLGVGQAGNGQSATRASRAVSAGRTTPTTARPRSGNRSAEADGVRSSLRLARKADLGLTRQSPASI
jgi:hypothetical protein